MAASVLITEDTSEVLRLQHKVCYARILDAKRKFLEAAGRYYSLSQIGAYGDLPVRAAVPRSRRGATPPLQAHAAAAVPRRSCSATPPRRTAAAVPRCRAAVPRCR
jgi:hypothetical protein